MMGGGTFVSYLLIRRVGRSAGNRARSGLLVATTLQRRSSMLRKGVLGLRQRAPSRNQIQRWQSEVTRPVLSPPPETRLAVIAPTRADEHRVALVIGNGRYQNVGALEKSAERRNGSI